MAANAGPPDEAATRALIDAQLAAAGWVRGSRPQQGRNLAIAEWPTTSGPADYVLFVGLVPVAVVEAKRRVLDVSAALQQAKRYSRAFALGPGLVSPGGPWGEFALPFAFASNGRPYLPQLSTKSGTWFCDLRRQENLGRALDGWLTPEGLLALLERDEAGANERLRQQGFEYGFDLRRYQIAAIEAVEAAIAAGQRSMLLAMATGTGKTKTSIALLYRLLKARRFRRVLFLVDRSALGEQAENAFKDTRMENLQTFADAFEVMPMEGQKPNAATAVHVATVQGLVRRVLAPGPGETRPPVDQYDCIVVDECHRGYLLDRELSDTEMEFRDFADYVSKYRRVLDAFDAVKIGLTATPALHTTEIFGLPIFTYSYREAVIDGYLVDHEPPISFETQLSRHGIVWLPGEDVEVYHLENSQLELFTTPDEIRLELEAFNRKVVTRNFNRVVAIELAREIDPDLPAKTLVFCVDDAHADLVVDELKRAFEAQYGAVEDDAVMKITGAADRPRELIRRFKNERNPNVAVTVDLLTTGIDVPAISNLVFLRRVASRILFDQMLGRATRLCPAIDKECFRIFDAVRLYEALHDLTAMQPVVANPAITFGELLRELRELEHEEDRTLVRDQLIAKLQRAKRHLGERQLQELETTTGMELETFIRTVRGLPPAELSAWLGGFPQLAEILDRPRQGPGRRTYVSHHEDALLASERGYGKGKKPADYLEEFAAFVKSQGDRLPALVTVLTRPRELTRQHLKELALALDRAGFTELSLTSAWRETTNQEVAAGILGFIRRAAIGDPLVPWERRVDRALERILASRAWSRPQRDWLVKIAKQTKANTVVDRAALDDPDQLFQREGGGFARLDRVFDHQLERVLDEFNEAIWTAVA